MREIPSDFPPKFPTKKTVALYIYIDYIDMMYNTKYGVTAKIYEILQIGPLLFNYVN